MIATAFAATDAAQHGFKWIPSGDPYHDRTKQAILEREVEGAERAGPGQKRTFFDFLHLMLESSYELDEAVDVSAFIPQSIEVNTQQHLVIKATIDAIAKDVDLYKRVDRLVHVIRERSDSEDESIQRSAGTPRIREASAGFLRERIAARCSFYRKTGDADKQIDPPKWTIDAIHTRGFWDPIRHLSGITEVPVLRPDGTIVSGVGWDPATGLLYEPGDSPPFVPESPSHSDAVAASGELLEVVSDFPFSSDVHRASWLAGLLTVLSRRAFSGPAPLFLIDSNVRGSGKSLLSDVIGLITTGRTMPRMSNPGDDDEARKRITSLAIAGDPLVLIDNIGSSSTLGSASLDSALTSTTWKDRRLGGNETVERPLRAVWFATGNNVMLAGDMSRRVCHIRLDSPEEVPEERTGFRQPRLVQYVQEHRQSLLTAGLTILRAFFVAGSPDGGLNSWGSFEGWSGLIRNCIVWLGLPDPAQSRREFTESSDRDAAALRLILENWTQIDPARSGLTAAQIIRIITDGGCMYGGIRDAFLDLCGTNEKGLTPRAIGNHLRRFRGRVVGDYRLSLREGHARSRYWTVESLSGAGNGDSGDTSDSFSDPLRTNLEPDDMVDNAHRAWG